MPATNSVDELINKIIGQKNELNAVSLMAACNYDVQLFENNPFKDDPHFKIEILEAALIASRSDYFQRDEKGYFYVKDKNNNLMAILDIEPGVGLVGFHAVPSQLPENLDPMYYLLVTILSAKLCPHPETKLEAYVRLIDSVANGELSIFKDDGSHDGLTQAIYLSMLALCYRLEKIKNEISSDEPAIRAISKSIDALAKGVVDGSTTMQGIYKCIVNNGKLPKNFTKDSLIKDIHRRIEKFSLTISMAAFKLKKSYDDRLTLGESDEDEDKKVQQSSVATKIRCPTPPPPPPYPPVNRHSAESAQRSPLDLKSDLRGEKAIPTVSSFHRKGLFNHDELSKAKNNLKNTNSSTKMNEAPEITKQNAEIIQKTEASDEKPSNTTLGSMLHSDAVNQLLARRRALDKGRDDPNEDSDNDSQNSFL